MYHKFYNYKAKPFRLSPDPSFFYSSNTHKRALSYLRYGIEQGEGFIVITGGVGTGKTTLVARLLKSLKKGNIVVANIVNSNLVPTDLLQMVSAQYNLAYKDSSKADMLIGMERFLLSCNEQNRRVLLIVDEAQNLTQNSVEELRMLSNMQYEGRQLLQCFLLGQKEFKKMIRGEGFEQLRQRVIAAYDLRALDINETKAYINHRMNVVGWNNDPVIDEEVLEGVYEYSKGIPRKVNLIFDRILLFGCLEELHHITMSHYEAVLEDVENEFWADDELDEPVMYDEKKRLNYD